MFLARMTSSDFSSPARDYLDMKATLLAKSSSGGSYDVDFLVDGECVRVFCHCQAGLQQWMCKHKLALVAGDNKMLFDPGQLSLLSEIRGWPQFARLRARLARYERELSEIEAAKAEAAKKEKAMKAQMGKDLTFGKYAP